ncbi:C-terminal binding protein [Chloroflexota bacterium]
MIENQFKVVRIDKPEVLLPMIEELEELSGIGAEVVEADWTTEDDIIEAARDADAVLTDTAQMTRRVLESSPKLKVVVCYGIGYDNIDVDAATDNGILVVNVPDYCFEEVSNHAMTLLLACAKKLVLLNDYTRQGRWIESARVLAPMGAVYGQTLGLIGCGNIGRMTARKAQCFGLRVLGFDPYLDKSLAGEYEISMVGLPELLRESDYVSLHAPLTKETWHLIGEKEFKEMKPGAYFINLSRGTVVDEAALIKALQEKWIAGVGLDVFEKEPVDLDNPLLKMENAVFTPHSAFYSDAAMKRLRESVGQETVKVLSGNWPKNVVNKTVKPKADLIRES